MALLTTGTWILVADEEKAMILKNTGDTRTPALTLVDRQEAEPYPEDSDRAGRLYDGGPNQRSAMEQVDGARIQGERFAADLVADLKAAADRGEFDRLVLAAPPQVLGAIRASLDSGLRGRIVAEIPKTLTRHPLPEIASLIAAKIDPL